MYKNIELLAPAGSYNSVIAAVNGGCDAIYIGGKGFNARAYADSPSDEQLKEIFDLCHLRGVKVFITINTLYKEKELADIISFINTMYQYGADGFIIQDLGIFTLLKDNFPHIELHASTQMTVHNTNGAVELENMGFNRVVLSRELSLEEIKNISKSIDADIECFVHGALCVSYSGRCLMSSLIGGRSGNRGRCAQPCRMEYTLIKGSTPVKKGYLLSPKDISTVEITQELIDAGIYSFKIEGRMKSPEYVYQVVSTYRKAIDNGFAEKNDLKNLTQIFNRGGSSTTGYYKDWAGNYMISQSPKSSGLYIGKVIKASKNKVTVKTVQPLSCGDGIEIWNSGQHTGCGISQEYNSGELITLNVKGELNAKVYKSFDKKLDDALKKTYKTLTRQSLIEARVYISTGKPALLELSCNKIKATVQGATVLKAENKPVTSDIIMEKLSKTGNTPFIFDFKEIIVDKDAYVPVSELNNLRRLACEALEQNITEHYRRNAVNIQSKNNHIAKADFPAYTVLVQNSEQFNVALNYNVKRIYIELSRDNAEFILNNLEKAHNNGIEIYVALPKIYRNNLQTEYAPIIEKLENSSIDGYLVRSFGSINTKKNIMYDYSLNVFNSLTIQALKAKGQVTLSPELNINELRAITEKGTEIVVYGRLTLMSTHQCPIGLYDSEKKGRFCSKRNKHPDYYLTDRKNAKFPIITHCDSCTAFILNSAPICVLNRLKEIEELGAEYMRIELTTEAKNEADNILKGYINKQNIVLNTETTNGHYFRGVL